MTTKPVINFAVDPALRRKIDDYQHKHRFPTRSTAVKYLLTWALRQNPRPAAEDLVACEWRRSRKRGD